MATPRPFNAPTQFVPDSRGEIAKQVARMKELTGGGSTPKPTAPGLPGPLGQVGNMFARGGALSWLNPMTPGGAILSTLQLPGSEDPSIKWARLGYPSKEAYEQALAGMPSVEEQTRRINNGGKSQMASFGDNYKEQEAALFVAAERSRGNTSSSLPPSAATPGEGPKGNEVGSDADPNTPGLQGPGAPIDPGRPSEVDGGINTGATVALDLVAANGLLSRGGSSENPNRFLAEGTQMADINSFLPATIPASPNDKPSAPVDQSESTQLGGDEVAEGVVTQQKPTTISADGADNTRSVSVPGEPEGPTNWMDRKNSPDSFLAARRAAFLDPNNRGYGAIRAADAATGRFRQGDKFFYNDAGTMREVDEQTWRKGQHQAINPLDEMEEGSKFMEGWKDSKIKPTLVPSEQTDITNPDADGGASPVVSDFNENNIGPVADSKEYGAMLNSQIGPVADGDVYGEHLKRAREKTKGK